MPGQVKPQSLNERDARAMRRTEEKMLDDGEARRWLDGHLFMLMLSYFPLQGDSDTNPAFATPTAGVSTDADNVGGTKLLKEARKDYSIEKKR
jgi:hypothetical protein